MQNAIALQIPFHYSKETKTKLESKAPELLAGGTQEMQKTFGHFPHLPPTSHVFSSLTVTPKIFLKYELLYFQPSPLKAD